ncbi:MAG: FAD-binding oxidoreductase, partial [Chromatiales bacterium]|nr:FAD-binding oxidoreductase [Chromatiales bacterium]
MKANVIIIGGGIVGSSVAYHLARTGQAGDICVIERDPSYEFAATPRSNGGIRRLFSRRQNIEMAQYGLDFYARFSTDMEVADGPVDIAFRHFGYLFLSDAGGARQMERNFVQQRDMGVDVQALTAAEVSERYPSVSGDGIELAVLSAHDAWIDP